MSAEPAVVCPLDDLPMTPQHLPHLFRCERCGTWGSTLDVRINATTERLLDEAERKDALAELRSENNETVLSAVARFQPLDDATLLDVGSAHGWFLAAARQRGAHAEGVEPDRVMADFATARGADVRVGFFPEVLADDEKFDVISFNDVLEHLPDVGTALADCRDTLTPGGVLSVNIPTSNGLVYRLSRALARVGLRGAFERLWQVGLPSPHLWYFDERNLAALGARHGLDVVHSQHLKSVTRTGLWSRVHFDRKPGPVSVLTFAALWLATPVLNAKAASDIMLLLFRRSNPAG